MFRHNGCARSHRELALVCLLVATACGSSAPTTPTDPGGGGGGAGAQSCRTWAISSTHVSVGTGFTSTTNQTCTLNQTTRQVTCTGQYLDSFGSSTTTTSIITYASIAAFVDEVAVVPPFIKSLGTSSTTGASASSSTHTYDAQGRLTRIAGQSAGGTVTTSYTQWDTAGRPTVGTDTGPGVANAIAITYNDAARTKTTSFMAGNGLVVFTTEVFDANGNPIAQSTAGPTSSLNTTITVNATERVCK